MITPEALVDAVREAIAQLDPSDLVEAALGEPPAGDGRVRVIAAGKAAFALATGAIRRWGSRVDDVLAVGTEDLDDGPLARAARITAVTAIRAGHPLPDARSEQAAREALRRARELEAGDVLLVLVSGGASALLAHAAEGASLPRKAALVAALLAAGAPIEAVNLVRRHVSRIKGGRLARAAGAAEVRTLLLSDVVGGAPWDLGSGPSTADPTRVEEARAALQTFAPTFAAEAACWLDESLKPGERADPAPRTLADPDALAHAVASRLRARGLDATALPGERGPVEAIAAARANAARSLPAGCAIVIPCEPTVALPATRGRGGRAGRTALIAAAALPEGVALLCAATDGVDGSSGAAGALVTRAALDAVPRALVDAAIAAYDDAPLHRRLGTAVDLGPTGTNLTDVHVLARLA